MVRSMSEEISDSVTNEQLDRLRDHFQLCNDIECPVCKLYGDGANKLSKAWSKLSKGYLIVKIV